MKLQMPMCSSPLLSLMKKWQMKLQMPNGQIQHHGETTKCGQPGALEINADSREHFHRLANELMIRQHWDLDEIVTTLKDHLQPALREDWIREDMANLAGEKQEAKDLMQAARHLFSKPVQSMRGADLQTLESGV